MKESLPPRIELFSDAVFAILITVMDGWGTPELKEKVYDVVITTEPVQFTGIKLFYKNDLKGTSSGLMPTRQILDLMPAPSYIQYQ
jgi:hypothetical protein